MDGARQCFCIGPQNGEPRCPCAMRNVRIENGRYVAPGQDLGPVPDRSLRERVEHFVRFGHLKVKAA